MMHFNLAPMRACVCVHVLGDVQGCALWNLTSKFRGARLVIAILQ